MNDDPEDPDKNSNGAGADSEQGLSSIDLDGHRSSSEADDNSEGSSLDDFTRKNLDIKFKVTEVEYQDIQRGKRSAVWFPGCEDAIITPRPSSKRGSKFAFDAQQDLTSADIPIFCCGFIPLEIVVLVVNIFSVLIGIASIALGAVQLGRGRQILQYDTSVNVLLASGPWIAGICCVVFGVILVIIGIVGAAIAEPVSRGHLQDVQKRWFFFFLTLSVLAILFFVLLAGISILSLNMLGNGNILSQTIWQGFLGQHPAQFCDEELHHSCAGYASGQCAGTFTPLSFQNCPGHFCIEFCYVVQGPQMGYVNTDPKCAGCIQSATAGYNFSACLQHEFSAATTGCSLPINSEIYDAFLAMIILSISASFWMLLVVGLASFRVCCRPRTRQR